MKFRQTRKFEIFRISKNRKIWPFFLNNLNNKKIPIFQRGATQSMSGSSNGSSTRFRPLDVNVSDLYYQDGPSSADPSTPNRSAQSPRPNAPLLHDTHPPQSPLASGGGGGGENRPQPVFFRAINKKLSSPTPRVQK